MMSPSIHAQDHARTFRDLHRAFFVMPNPWDVTTARMLASFGFRAIATSSAAFAWSRGVADGGVTRDQAIAHAAALSEATGLPINGDFEDGFGDSPQDVAETVRAAIDAGIAGCSVEDLWRNGPEPLHHSTAACRRIEAARTAIEQARSDFVLTARCEAFFTPATDPLALACSRVRLYREAGADVLYVPLLRTPEAVTAVMDAADGHPVNVLMGVGGISDDPAALEALGVTRISSGSGLARTALGAFLNAVKALAAGDVDLPGAVGSSVIEAVLANCPGPAATDPSALR